MYVCMYVCILAAWTGERREGRERERERERDSIYALTTVKSPPTTVLAKGGDLYGIMRGMPAPGVAIYPRLYPY